MRIPGAPAARKGRLRIKRKRSGLRRGRMGGKAKLRCEPVRVLIVDNDMSSADSLELMLHAFGHLQTRVAYSGHAALVIGAEFRPDVALLEINLLDMSGYAVAQSLREQAQTHQLRLIALTSSREH